MVGLGWVRAASLVLATMAGTSVLFGVSPWPGAPACADSAFYGFKVIVHPGNHVRSVTWEFLTNAYFKRTTRWSDGELIRPVDLPVDAAPRAAFSTRVLQRSVPAVRAYWLQRIFSGHQAPPPELGSDAEVVHYVLVTRGALGYVSGAAEVSAARVVRIE